MLLPLLHVAVAVTSEAGGRTVLPTQYDQLPQHRCPRSPNSLLRVWILLLLILARGSPFKS